MWRGELRAVISQFAFTLWTLWNDDVLGSCYWLVSGTWTLLCDACRRPESPLKKYKGNEKVTWLVKKVPCLDFNRKLPSQWMRCAAVARETEIKLLLSAAAVVFKSDPSLRQVLPLYIKKHICWFRVVILWGFLIALWVWGLFFLHRRRVKQYFCGTAGSVGLVVHPSIRDGPITAAST